MQGRTTLLIAHRRSTLGLADRIAVLDGGRLADIGTHEELQERSALYRRLLTDPDELGGVSPGPRPARPPPERGHLRTGRAGRRVRRRARRRRPGCGRGDREPKDTARWPACPPPPNSSPRSTRCPRRPTPRTSTRRARSRPEESYGLRRLLRGFGRPLLVSLALVAVDAGHGPAAAGADPARHRPGRHRGWRSARSGRPPLLALLAVARPVGGADRRDPDDRPHRRTGPVLAAPEDLRPAPAARTRLLRAGADRPDHDPDDDGRRRPVHVPADRPGHRLRLASSPSSASWSRCW